MMQFYTKNGQISIPFLKIFFSIFIFVYFKTLYFQGKKRSLPMQAS